MSKLSPEAKAYCKDILLKQGRTELVSQLESIGIACYDEEDDETLADSAVDSVEAGDIDFDWGLGQAKAFGHHSYMLWLDVEDVWV